MCRWKSCKIYKDTQMKEPLVLFDFSWYLRRSRHFIVKFDR